MTETTTLQSLQQQQESESSLLTRKQAPMSLTTGLGFEQLSRVAKVLNQSTMVPAQYRNQITTGSGNNKRTEENPSGLANCIVALNMAVRMDADPLQIMQSLYVIEGRPSWSSQFIIAMINNSGKFSPLRFELSEPGPVTEVEYTVTVWENNQRKREKRTAKCAARTCRAWAYELATGERIDGPEVSMAMAIAEGWFSKDGSKWQTMPEVMLRYRAAAFFGRFNAPELLMGLRSREEEEDVLEASRDTNGNFSVPLDELNSRHHNDAAQTEQPEKPKPTRQRKPAAKTEPDPQAEPEEEAHDAEFEELPEDEDGEQAPTDMFPSME